MEWWGTGSYPSIKGDFITSYGWNHVKHGGFTRLCSHLLPGCLIQIWIGTAKCPGHLAFYFRDNGRKKTDSPEKTKKLRKIQENPILIY